jgi:ATP-dependent helicase/nuclease subunit B
MFEPQDHPRVYGLAPGVDFPRALVVGLRDRTRGQPPEAMARIELIVNTRRMARRLRDIFDAGPPGLLPRIRLLTRLEGLVPGIAPPPATPPLRRRLALIELVSRLLDADPSLAPRASLYDLSDSLAGLIDEMQGEGVAAEEIAALDVSDLSGHWDRARRFLAIAQTYLEQTIDTPDTEARQRQMVTRIAARWAGAPPQHPVIIAGSTGSRGTTAMLMQAIARLPQGAVVLPGFDFDMPTAVWAALDDALMSEDHPQYRFRQLMQALDLPRDSIAGWTDTPAPSPARNALVSLSLRPAPVTHAWMTEGPRLEDLSGAADRLTLVEAPTPRIEALAIALRLRRAVEDGQTAALITPDRMLTRQVTAALDRWDILPDDSAGTPLHLSPPGRFLRHVAGLLRTRLDAGALLTLLKHPLTHSGPGRNAHLLHTQRLEMRLRRDGLPYPDVPGIARLAERIGGKLKEPEDFNGWATWVADTFPDRQLPGTLPLADWVAGHVALAEAVAAGKSGSADHGLWQEKAGRKALEVMQELAGQAPHGGQMTAADYGDLVSALLQGAEVRDRDAPRPDVMIWGTLEARVQGADLVILGGLNDGSWPEAPAPDPWLNRRMRLQAGLLLPERRIGLSAHDYQQAIGAPEVWLTRAIRSDEAETVPSRWLNRLGNLMGGLKATGGPQAWEDMRARGAHWLGQVAALEEVTRVPPAPRPAPRPPRSARPDRLSVTEIKHLIRDPYAIYARHVLRLRAIDPLVQSPDAPLRGIVLHRVMEEFIRATVTDPALLTRETLMTVAARVLEEEAPWPAARMMWLARIGRIADWFIAREGERRRWSGPAAFETRGEHIFPALGFTLRGFADRIDRTEDGDALIYDYKTGKPPSKKEQRLFDKQLLIEAAMVEEGGFTDIGARPVAQAVFIGLGARPEEVAAPLDEETPAEVLSGLHDLIASYLSPTQGFTARRMVQSEASQGEFDQLARFGEWDGTTRAAPEDVQ